MGNPHALGMAKWLWFYSIVVHHKQDFPALSAKARGMLLDVYEHVGNDQLDLYYKRRFSMIKMYLWQLSAAQLHQLEHGDVILMQGAWGEWHYCWVEWVSSDCLTVHI